jgi:Protein of unknown function, DUF488
MLRRQRTILEILGKADGRLSATQLQKFIFLLREETFLGKDSAFYDFLPYRFGAYSFSAQREIEALTTYGYIESINSTIGVTSLGRAEARQADSDTSRAVLAILSKYEKLPLRTLLKDVYGRYPWYASKSELKDLVPTDERTPETARTAIYTIGYEEASIDRFLNHLLRSGIRRIIDIRANPVSRKYGFARSSLSTLAGKLGLGYCHFPELGISSARRREANTPCEFRELFGYYEREILPAKADAVGSVAEIMRSAPSVLVCMEKEAVDCHRSRLARRIATTTDLDVVHL